MKAIRAYLPSRIKRRYDYHPDLPDKRDHYFQFSPGATVPDKVDLRPQMSRVEDQGDIGSCTANAWVGAIEYLDKEKDGHYRNWSRLFLYYNERALHGNQRRDSGAEIRDGAKALAKQGICLEAHWKYDVKKFATKPPAACYTEGLKHQALEYSRVDQNEQAMLSALAQGNPIVLGFTVYESFESGRGGEDRHGADAEDQRKGHGWPRRARGRLRPPEAAVHHPQLMGQRVGRPRVLLFPVRLSARRRSGRGLLDHPDAGEPHGCATHGTGVGRRRSRRLTWPPASRTRRPWRCCRANAA